MITIDEAITRMEEQASDQTHEAILAARSGDNELFDACLESVKEFYQIAGWLKELKAYKGQRERRTA